MKLTLIRSNEIVNVETNSFGDQVIYYKLHGISKSTTFPEGHHVDPKEFLNTQLELINKKVG